MHSVMNTLFAPNALKNIASKKDIFEVYESLSNKGNGTLRNKVTKEALEKGMFYIEDRSGANIDVQIFDTNKIDSSKTDIKISKTTLERRFRR